MNRLLPARRAFVRFLASSPLLAMAQDSPSPTAGSAKDALSVMDFEQLAQKALPPAHWGFMASGVDDDLTLRMNREAIAHYQLRARRLAGIGKPDLSTDVFGLRWDMPVYLSAVGGQKAFHSEGELATARAAKASKTTQMLSTNTSTSVEDVSKALGNAPWFQLYMPVTWPETEKLVRRVEAAECRVLAWTIDRVNGRNTETATRLARGDSRDCLSCHVTHPITGSSVQNRRALPISPWQKSWQAECLPHQSHKLLIRGGGAGGFACVLDPKSLLPRTAMFAGLSGELHPTEANWSYVDRLKNMTKIVDSQGD